MIINHTKKLWMFFFRHEFLRYAFTGGTTTIVDFGMFVFLTRVAGIHYLYANIVSFLLAAVTSYTMNRIWTFKNTSEQIVSQFAAFSSISVVGLLLNTSILAYLVQAWEVHDVVAKVCATAIVLFWNYFMNKHITFKRI